MYELVFVWADFEPHSLCVVLSLSGEQKPVGKLNSPASESSRPSNTGECSSDVLTEVS